MTKYYLVQENKEELSIIDFSKIDECSEFNSTNLKDIISFTSMFKNEKELKELLVNHNLIKVDNFNKKLKITYNYKKERKTLMYGITYENDIKFFNEVYIKRYLYENKNNYELLETLCNHYRNSYNQGLNIDTIREYIRFFKKYETDSNTDYLDDDKKEMISDFEKAINSFVFKEIYRYDKKNNEYKENFKGLRDLAMFLSYQEKKNKEEIISEKQNNEESNINKPKVKTKKKDNNIPGQLTFADMGWL